MNCLILHEDLGKKGMCKNSVPVSITDNYCNASEVPPGEAWHGDQPPTLFI